MGKTFKDRKDISYGERSKKDKRKIKQYRKNRQERKGKREPDEE
jgi:hypothetical protein